MEKPIVTLAKSNKVDFFLHFTIQYRCNVEIIEGARKATKRQGPEGKKVGKKSFGQKFSVLGSPPDLWVRGGIHHRARVVAGAVSASRSHLRCQ